MKKIFKAFAIVGLAFASVLGLASCGENKEATLVTKTNHIKIGIYNQGQWDGVGQSDNIASYMDYLTTNLKDSSGQVIFEYVKSNTINLAEEVNNFITQGCDGIIVLNTKTTPAVESACKKAGVFHFNMSNEVTSTDVGKKPSSYCLGGVKNYFGDYEAFAKQWLDSMKADMQARGLTSAKVVSVEFPASINPAHQDLMRVFEGLVGTGDYANITLTKRWQAAGVPLANYMPTIITEMKTKSSSEGFDYVLGLANGAKTLTGEFNKTAERPFGDAKLLCIGYSDANRNAYDSYLLSQAECGLEGLIAGLTRIYQGKTGALKNGTITDLATYKNSDGIVNVKTAWHIFDKTQYNDFVNYMYGGQVTGTASHYSTVETGPAVTAAELKTLLSATTLSSLEAITNRTISQVVASKRS